MDTDVEGTFLSGDIDAKQEGWLRGWFTWSYSTMALLRNAEKKILSYIKSPFKVRYVNIGDKIANEECKIWTLSLNEEEDNTPLCLLHGLGSGIALWTLNVDTLASTRPVYAIDILGFGRSSRPKFSTHALDAEHELVESIEEWRREMKLERFHILGHSFGGFLATSYALSHPERVAHLILADPWGFPDKPTDLSQRYPIPFWVKMVAYLLQPLNPLWGVRLAGPMGPKLIEKVRPDLIKKYEHLTGGDDSIIAEYIFHCNAQNPSGEAAFHTMMSTFGWAKYPMCNRIPSLSKDVPLTLIYGSRSWVDHSPGGLIKTMRGESYVNVQVIHGAGHHVYADKKDKFNQIVLNACEFSDKVESNIRNKVDTSHKICEPEPSEKSDHHLITQDDSVLTVLEKKSLSDQ